MYPNLGNTDILLYDIFVMVGFLAVLVFNFCQIGKKRLFPGKVSEKIINYTKNRNKKIPIEIITAFTEIFLISIFQYALGGIYNSIFGKIMGMNANYYGIPYFSPLMIAFICLLMGTDLIKVFDMITPSYLAGLIFAKIACFCAGCCRGFEWEHGLYNQTSGLVEFPVQLVEMGIALLIFVFLLLIRKKAKPGTLFPLYLILYSSTRFFSEFLRVEPDVFGKLKAYQIFCLVGVVIGIIEYIIGLKFSDKISLLFTKAGIITGFFGKISAEISFNYWKIKKRITKKDKQVIHHKKKRKKK